MLLNEKYVSLGFTQPVYGVFGSIDIRSDDFEVARVLWFAVPVKGGSFYFRSVVGLRPDVLVCVCSRDLCRAWGRLVDEAPCVVGGFPEWDAGRHNG